MTLEFSKTLNIVICYDDSTKEKAEKYKKYLGKLNIELSNKLRFNNDEYDICCLLYPITQEEISDINKSCTTIFIDKEKNHGVDYIKNYNHVIVDDIGYNNFLKFNKISSFLFLEGIDLNIFGPDN
jgi:hypothetical protein